LICNYNYTIGSISIPVTVTVKEAVVDLFAWMRLNVVVVVVGIVD